MWKDESRKGKQKTLRETISKLCTTNGLPTKPTPIQHRCIITLLVAQLAKTTDQNQLGERMVQVVQVFLKRMINVY